MALDHRPQSLTPRSRLIADMTSPPQNPIRVIDQRHQRRVQAAKTASSTTSAAPSAVALSDTAGEPLDRL